MEREALKTEEVVFFRKERPEEQRREDTEFILKLEVLGEAVQKFGKSC
jgi:hypothetical protein